MWETKAKVDSAKKRSRLNKLKNVWVLKEGMRMTKKATNMAYSIRNHVRTAQMIPQMSL
jgi:hypothetical protein